MKRTKILTVLLFAVCSILLSANLHSKGKSYTFSDYDIGVKLTFPSIFREQPKYDGEDGREYNVHFELDKPFYNDITDPMLVYRKQSNMDYSYLSMRNSLYISESITIDDLLEHARAYSSEAKEIKKIGKDACSFIIPNFYFGLSLICYCKVHNGAIHSFMIRCQQWQIDKYKPYIKQLSINFIN
ncbi:MAG: hypothetical protein LBO69_09825 [Ignavibacteria bacterium]|jgi:hypothetical protein|nr:hypothetical protein [Ignavibacteria bacterium]